MIELKRDTSTEVPYFFFEVLNKYGVLMLTSKAFYDKEEALKAIKDFDTLLGKFYREGIKLKVRDLTQ